MQRLIVANLDCEQDLAHPDAPRALPAPVRQRISAAGALLAVFGRPGDTLWTPEPVDPARIAVPGAANLRLASGPLERQRRPDALLCWGETRATRALCPVSETMPQTTPGHAPGATPKNALELETWPEALWQLRADPAISRRCNDRRYCLGLVRELGLALPGAAVLRSVDELTAHLDHGHHMHGHDETWVVEAPFSASGRFRLRRHGPAPESMDEATRTRARRLFATFGELIFQPWMDRVFDIGCVGLIAGPERWRVLAPHGLHIDAAGVFRGVTVGPPEKWVEPAMVNTAIHAAAQIADTTAEVARRLAGDGYRGPFGIDGFVYRDHDGQLRVHPMCEINARLSFGLVAHALARVHAAECARLIFADSGHLDHPGDSGPRGDSGDPAPRVIALLHPGSSDPTTARLEIILPHDPPASPGRSNRSSVTGASGNRK